MLPRHAIHHSGDEPAPCVVIAHGFKGFMGWGMFPWLAEQLAGAGFAAVRFDFRHNGADENGDFTRLDLFRQNTLTKEQADFAAIVGAIAAGEEPFAGRCRRERIGLLGHSRGGGGSILYAAKDPRVAAVATMAAVASTDRYPPEVKAIAEKQGYYEIENARTKQMMPIGVEYFRDAPRHDVLGSVRSMRQPLLCVHGTKDASVPIEEGRTLRDAGATLVEIEGASHTFGAVHPFQGPTPHLEQAAATIVEFFRGELA